MKMLKTAMLSAVALGMVLAPVMGQAQTSNPVTAAMMASLHRSSKIMVAAAAKMPAG